MRDTMNYSHSYFSGWCKWEIRKKQGSQNDAELNQELNTNAVWHLNSHKNLCTFNNFAMQTAAEGINAFIVSCILMKTLSLLSEGDNTLNGWSVIGKLGITTIRAMKLKAPCMIWTSCYPIFQVLAPDIQSVWKDVIVMFSVDTLAVETLQMYVCSSSLHVQMVMLGKAANGCSDLPSIVLLFYDFQICVHPTLSICIRGFCQNLKNISIWIQAIQESSFYDTKIGVLCSKK